MAERRTTDASKLSFPLQLVIIIVGTAIAGYTSQSSMRSDLRDIQTRLELGRDITKAQSTAQDEKLSALKASVDSTSVTMKSAIEAVAKKQELQALQITELSEKLTKLSAGRK